MVTFPFLTLESIRADYAAGRSVAGMLREVYGRIAARGEDAVWIYRPSLDQLLAQIPEDRSLPLYGIPFAVKDNIDVAGWPTTAGCPAYSYIAERDSAVVARLRAAGAIPVGKTNLDQFATGLVGVRSPYGIPRSIYHDGYISGGSSSGSAVAVAAGLVPFSLGTDTAGSGRVPAAFNGIVGIKGTRGLVSATGVVPACRSLDCVTIFAPNVREACELLEIAEAYDPTDPYSRPRPDRFAPPVRIVGIPAAEQLQFFGDEAAAAQFERATQRLRVLGYTIVEIDFTPFRDAARLLYGGAWVAERYAAIEGVLLQHPEQMDPVVRGIIEAGGQLRAVDAYRGSYELERLKQLAAAQWKLMDAMMLPTAGTIYKVDAVLADPVRLNANLGYYTNFMNLMDLCGLAVPAGIRPDGLPFGVTFVGKAFTEEALGEIGARFTEEPVAEAVGGIALAVVGAHLTGQPLNGQLRELGARFRESTRTSGAYRLFALPNTSPEKPGMIRDPGFAGEGIEVEIWMLSESAFGRFTAQIPFPLGIGSIELADGRWVKGFLCEGYAVAAATEITRFGGWRGYLAAPRA